MKALLLALQLFSYMPAVQSVPKEPPAPRPEGTGTILVASCQPSAIVAVEPGHLRGIADKDGVVRIQAPAQAPEDDSYQIYVNGALVVMNGTLSAHESLSAVCP